MRKRKTKTAYSFHYENLLGSRHNRYKVLYILPTFAIARDTQGLKEFGISSWEFYFEFLWFQVSLDVEKYPEDSTLM